MPAAIVQTFGKLSFAAPAIATSTSISSRACCTPRVLTQAHERSPRIRTGFPVEAD